MIPKLIEEDYTWCLRPDTYAETLSSGRWKRWKHLKYISSRITESLRKGNARIVISSPPRHGKALEINTPILTTKGFKKIIDLKIGDSVFDLNGNPVEVIWKSEIFKNRECYKVTTDDGAELIADSEHIWKTRLCRKRKSFTLRNTTYLAKRKSPRRPLIPTFRALKFKEKKLPIPPYTLGSWLGDGRARYGFITQSTEDSKYILERIKSEGFEVRDHTDVRNHGILGLQVLLRNNGLIDNKHIPKIYFEASIDQKISLLNGLIDTYGYVAKDGQVEFCSIDLNLAKQVQKLVRTLGIKASLIEGNATINGRFISKKYRIMFYYENAAGLPRKKHKCKNGQRTPGRFLSFEKAKSQDTVCIQVNSKDGMFLAGEGLIVTHNSEFISVWVPTWFLDMYPQKRVIIASYGERLSRHFGRRVKNNIMGNSNVSITIARDSKASTEFHTVEGGGLVTCGVGGSITGRGGDLLIIDDPVRNMKDTMSKDMRENQKEWFRSTFYTRKEPNASIIVLQTRWHEDDLAGFLINHHEDNWESINLPAIAEEEDILQRIPGEALCPERYDEKALSSIKDSVGSRIWASLYQGHPRPGEGVLWKRHFWKRWKTIPEGMERFISSWDAAIKEDGSSFNVGQVWGQKGADRYLLDQVRGKFGFVQLQEKFRQLAAKWPQASQIIVEDKANGPALQNVMKSEIPGILLVSPQGGKEVRAMACEPEIESGNVYLPQDEVMYPWVKEFIEEAAMFPNAENDDQVDAASQALIHLKSRGTFFSVRSEGKNIHSDKKETGHTRIADIKSRRGGMK